MAIYKLFPKKDTTIYSAYPVMNTGLDPILEISTIPYNTYYEYPQVSRILIQFNDEELEDIKNNKIENKDWEAYLKVFSSNISNLSTNTQVDIFLCAKDWREGTGKFKDNPQIIDGANWVYSDYSGSTEWIPDGETFEGDYGLYTGSYNENYAEVGGGVWYTETTGSLDYGWALSSSVNLYQRGYKDINENITELVYHLIGSGSNSPEEALIPNYGFLIKQSSSREFLDFRENDTVIKYFSVDTHTIYPPYLEFRWEDYSYNTGSSSNTILNTSSPYISIKNNPGKFHNNTMNRFRVYSRPEFPLRTFQTSSLYTTNYYLPQSASYALKDLHTNEYVINFDPKYTKISADSISSYFDIYMDGLEPERYYKILISCSIEENQYIFDDNYNFKVISG
jgi:hypothetical protein